MTPERMTEAEIAELLVRRHGRHGYVEVLCSKAHAEITRLIRERDEAYERAAKIVPHNWMDNLLTGPKGIGSPPYDCRDIEKLLRGIKDGIRALTASPTPEQADSNSQRR